MLYTYWHELTQISSQIFYDLTQKSSQIFYELYQIRYNKWPSSSRPVKIYCRSITGGLEHLIQPSRDWVASIETPWYSCSPWKHGETCFTIFSPNLSLANPSNSCCLKKKTKKNKNLAFLQLFPHFSLRMHHFNSYNWSRSRSTNT